MIGTCFLRSRPHNEIYLNLLKNELFWNMCSFKLKIQFNMVISWWNNFSSSLWRRDFSLKHILKDALERTGFIEWAARSPDLNTMDFLYWDILNRWYACLIPVPILLKVRQRTSVIKLNKSIYYFIRFITFFKLDNILKIYYVHLKTVLQN